MANMFAYPGRTFGQLYHAFFRVNSLADGKIELREGEEIDLARGQRQPVLSVAGNADVLAPKAAVHHVGGLLPNAPEVRLETAPGGHLGVLTGRSAIGDDVALPGRVPGAPRPAARRRARDRTAAAPPAAA